MLEEIAMFEGEVNPFGMLLSHQSPFRNDLPPVIHYIYLAGDIFMIIIIIIDGELRNQRIVS